MKVEENDCGCFDRRLARLTGRSAAQEQFAASGTKGRMYAKYELERLLTVREVAVLENVCTRTIRRRVASGELPAIREGRQLRFRPRDLEAYRLRRLLG